MGLRLRARDFAMAPFILSMLIPLLIAPAAAADSFIGAEGSAAGQYKAPQNLAIDTSNGHLYVADAGNSRVDVFDKNGVFLFAFGWRVNASAPEEKLQACSAASGCLAGTPGPGAGQFNHPESIAVDSSSHSVYVGESVNHRVQKFDAEGNFAWMVGGEVDTVTNANLCTVPANCGIGEEAKKEAGKEEGRFFKALDITGLPLAIGPGGILYVADSRPLGAAESEGFNTRIQRLEPSGGPVGPQLFLAGAVSRVQSLAADPGANIYVVNLGMGAVSKYDAVGNPVTAWGEGGKVSPIGTNWGLTLDPAGNLFVSDSAAVPEILEFDPVGTKIKVFFPPGLSDRASGLAFYSGGLFATDRHSVLRIELPDPGPLLIPGSLKASPIGNVRATLKVNFNPEGKASTARFQYITKADYEAAGNSFDAGTLTTPDSAPTLADFDSHTAQAANVCPVDNPIALTCLQPETTYYFRAIVSNEDGEATSEKEEFATLAPLQILATWATDVGTDSARLQAEVNPLGIATVGRFEYIDDAHFQSEGGFASPHTQTTGTIDFGAGEAAAIRSVELVPLQPVTTYHYRLVAEDPFFPSGESEVHTFTTFASSIPPPECSANAAFRIGPSAALPDCRAYEMVSPIDKSNGDLITRLNITGYPTNLAQSSSTGAGFTYSSYRAFADPEAAPYTNQYLASRHERGEANEGWRSESIDPLRGRIVRVELENAYQAFSADLSSSWLRQEGPPTLDPCAPEGFANLYHRDNASGAFKVLSCDQPSQEPSIYMPELQGFSDDGSHSVFRINEALASSSPLPSGATTGTGGGTRPIYQVYEASASGALRLVSVLPSGEVNEVDSSAGMSLRNEIANHNRFQSVSGAVSADGTRVFWSTGQGAGADLPAHELRPSPEQSRGRSVHAAGQSLHDRGLGNGEQRTGLLRGGEPGGHQGALHRRSGAAEREPL